MNNYCIEISGLNYLDLFKNFNLNIEKEKFITISGANNCGKTTLLRIIDGQLYSYNILSINGKKYEEYKITETNNIIKSVIPLEITFVQETVEEELMYQIPLGKKKLLKEIAKTFKLTKLLTKSVETLSEQDIIKLQLAIAVITSPQIILIDDLYPYFNKQELLDIVKTISTISKKDKITIIMISSLLDCNLLSDYTYILNKGEIVLEGEPLEVLQKDNIINKAGLNLPFMIDLSVKLKDYDLIKEIELNMDNMVEQLWK